jgi:hypothetical protein
MDAGGRVTQEQLPKAAKAQNIIIATESTEDTEITNAFKPLLPQLTFYT